MITLSYMDYFTIVFQITSWLNTIKFLSCFFFLKWCKNYYYPHFIDKKLAWRDLCRSGEGFCLRNVGTRVPIQVVGYTGMSSTLSHWQALPVVSRTIPRDSDYLDTWKSFWKLTIRQGLLNRTQDSMPVKVPNFPLRASSSHDQLCYNEY